MNWKASTPSVVIQWYLTVGQKCTLVDRVTDFLLISGMANYKFEHTCSSQEIVSSCYHTYQILLKEHYRGEQGQSFDASFPTDLKNVIKLVLNFVWNVMKQNRSSVPHLLEWNVPVVAEIFFLLKHMGLRWRSRYRSRREGERIWRTGWAPSNCPCLKGWFGSRGRRTSHDHTLSRNRMAFNEDKCRLLYLGKKNKSQM